MTGLHRRRPTVLAWTLCLAGCFDGGRAESGAAAGDEPTNPVAVVVPERWTSPSDTSWNLDSPAVWHGADESLVLATGKETHDLQVFDASTGQLRAPLGSPGEGPAQFRRPNGIVVVGDLALVVERDNHRVQVLSLPDGASMGVFGEAELRYPYGITVQGTLAHLTVWITDDYPLPADPETGDYSARLHRFEVQLDQGAPLVSSHQEVGPTDPAHRLEVVESIAVDPEAGLLLIADEAAKAYLVFDAQVRPQGTDIGRGTIQGDPEGIALVDCGSGRGYWIATDQRETVSLFHVFDRVTLAPRGTFRGESTTNTDGVAFTTERVPGLEGAAFFAVHDDQGLSAFSWSDIRAALELDATCLTPGPVLGGR